MRIIHRRDGLIVQGTANIPVESFDLMCFQSLQLEWIKGLAGRNGPSCWPNWQQLLESMK